MHDVGSTVDQAQPQPELLHRMPSRTIRAKRPLFMTVFTGFCAVILFSAAVQLPDVDLTKLPAYQRTLYVLSPVGTPFIAFVFAFFAYDVLRPRHLTVTWWGLRTRTWALHWSEVTDVRVHRGPRIALDVTEEAYRRERWRNKRDASRVGGLAIGLLPPRRNTINCSEHLKHGGPELIDELHQYRQHYLSTMPTSAHPPAQPHG